MSTLTLRDFREAKGRRKFTEVHVVSSDEARACADAGIDMLIVEEDVEVIPERVATGISQRVDIAIIPLGSGAGCDVQYLFACDILNITQGHIPRHAKTYIDIFPKLERIQKMRVDAFRAFHEEVTALQFPEPRNQVETKDNEFDKFMSEVDKI